ncbi:hypothetical protein M407DRAFT_246160, partial [Tulasnella calospora MUT 4182]
MSTLSHENIVQLIGFVEDLGNGEAWIILSWEPNGNVSEFLASGEWEVPERISLIQDTFEGLKYLHTRQPPICHGDLKSLNILVSSSYRAIITDFGSARVVRESADGGTSEVDDGHCVPRTRHCGLGKARILHKESTSFHTRVARDYVSSRRGWVCANFSWVAKVKIIAQNV